MNKLILILLCVAIIVAGLFVVFKDSILDSETDGYEFVGLSEEEKKAESEKVETQTPDTQPTENENTDQTVQMTGQFTKNLSYTDANGNTVSFPYWLYIPLNANENTPVIVALHCSYNKLTDEFTPEQNLDNMVDSEGKDIPAFMFNGKMGDIQAYIIMPQTSGASRGWSSIGKNVVGLVDYCKRTYNLVGDNVSVTGYSMGATGACELAAQYPEVFRRVVSVAGGLDGISNNTRPYKRDMGYIQLTGEYAGLLVVKNGKADPVTIKYLYEADNEKYMTVTEPEKAAATNFKNQRIAELASVLNAGRVGMWVMAGSNDVETVPTVPQELCALLDPEMTNWHYVEGYGHARMLDEYLANAQAVVNYLTFNDNEKINAE